MLRLLAVPRVRIRANARRRLTAFGRLVKAALLVGPIFVIAALGMLAVALVMTPFNLALALFAVLFTSKLGPTIKVFGALMVIAPILLWPAFNFIAASVVALCGGVVFPIGLTMFADDRRDALVVGFVELPVSAAKAVQLSWKYHRSYQDFMLETGLDRSCTTPADIPLHLLFLGIFAFVGGTVFMAIVYAVTGLVWIIPLTLRAFFEICKSCVESLKKNIFNGIAVTFFAMCAVPFVPVGLVGLWALMIIGSVGVGLWFGFEVSDWGSAWKGLMKCAIDPWELAQELTYRQ